MEFTAKCYIFREKKASRPGALKVLSYATAVPDGGPNCDKYIEIGGLLNLITFKTIVKLIFNTFRAENFVSTVYAYASTDQEKGYGA